MDVWFRVSGPLAKEGDFPAFAALYRYNTNMISPQLAIRGSIIKLFFLLLVKRAETPPPPPFLTTSVFYKDFLD